MAHAAMCSLGRHKECVPLDLRMGAHWWVTQEGAAQNWEQVCGAGRSPWVGRGLPLPTSLPGPSTMGPGGCTQQGLL